MSASKTANLHILLTKIVLNRFIEDDIWNLWEELMYLKKHCLVVSEVNKP